MSGNDFALNTPSPGRRGGRGVRSSTTLGEGDSSGHAGFTRASRHKCARASAMKASEIGSDSGVYRANS